jgi:hypothetical protein
MNSHGIHAAVFFFVHTKLLVTGIGGGTGK